MAHLVYIMAAAITAPTLMQIGQMNVLGSEKTMPRRNEQRYIQLLQEGSNDEEWCQQLARQTQLHTNSDVTYSIDS